jgi:cytochrome c oxidase subunit II
VGSPARRRLFPLALIAAALLLSTACGEDSDPVLTGEAARGQQIARARGCTNCHTSDGRRSEGPTWKGLAGSSVTLTDGRSVVVDDDYLTRSIREPSSQMREGFRTPMPVQSVTDDELAAIIAYINALA